MAVDSGGAASTARARATRETVRAPGASLTLRRTVTMAWMGEQRHATSSAPLAAAISVARAWPPLDAGFLLAVGVRAASAAMSAAVWVAALAAANAATSTATIPASSTNAVRASPTRVAPPPSPCGGPADLAEGVTDPPGRGPVRAPMRPPPSR
jgi:hypothetical protein